MKLELHNLTNRENRLFLNRIHQNWKFFTHNERLTYRHMIRRQSNLIHVVFEKIVLCEQYNNKKKK